MKVYKTTLIQNCGSYGRSQPLGSKEQNQILLKNDYEI